MSVERRHRCWLSSSMLIALTACSSPESEPEPEAVGEVDEELIPEHNKYSESYQRNWSTLPPGDQLGDHDPATQSWTTLAAQENTYFAFNGEAMPDPIRGAYEVSWQSDDSEIAGDQYFIEVSDCDRVIISGLYLRHVGSKYAAGSVYINNCETVVIRNSYFAGATAKYHITIRDAANVFIDRVEIEQGDDEAVDYADAYSTHGIAIDNTAGSGHAPRWTVVQNSYLHDMRVRGDGIAVGAPGNGILFNNVLRDWAGDGHQVLDLSHRQSAEDDYSCKHFRVERNRVEGGGTLNNPGTSDASNTLFFANNVFEDVVGNAYQEHHPIYHVHETWLYSADNDGPLMKLKTDAEEASGTGWHFRNNVMMSAADPTAKVFYVAARSGEHTSLTPEIFSDGTVTTNHNLYQVCHDLTPLLDASGEEMGIDSLAEMQAQHGQEMDSAVLSPDEVADACATKNAGALRGEAYAVDLCHPNGSGGTIEMRVRQGFHGNQRGGAPFKGAFESCNAMSLSCPR